MNAPQIFTFDIFDTLLTRIVLNPKDVFLLMQDSLTKEMPHLPAGLRKNFQSARVWAEFVARRKSRLDDIGLDAIYQVVAQRYRLTENQCDYLKIFEMRLEKSVIVPIDGAKELLSSARQHGRIVFVSDMYLPATFLKALLDRFELRVGEEPIYVSGDVGATKGSGRLFQQVFRDFNVHPSTVTHCGDHRRSDVEVPMRLGMQVHPACRSMRRQDANGRLRYAKDLFMARWRLGWFTDVR